MNLVKTMYPALDLPISKGLFEDMAKRSKKDGLEIHHVPQKQTAQYQIVGYSENKAPSIALPDAEHHLIPNFKGTNSAGNARQQLAHDVRNLRKFTQAPREQIEKLMNLVKTMYPEAFEKLKK